MAPPPAHRAAAVASLQERAAAGDVPCPVPGCRTSSKLHKDRGALGRHLAKEHADLDAATLATNGFASCPKCPGRFLCLLPRATNNGYSIWVQHAMQCTSGREAIRVNSTRATWPSAQADARAAAVGLAASGSLGAEMAVCLPCSPNGTDRTSSTTASPATRTTARPTSADANGAASALLAGTDDDSHVDIPILPADVDLSCLRHIDVNRHVRSIARHLRMQDLPDSYGLMSELLQSAVVGVDLHAADPTSERGALGLYLMDLAPAYIFRRPPDVEPYSKPELRRRAAAVVDSLVDGTFHLRWLDFIRPALQLNATADADYDDDLTMEEAAADDYDGMPAPPALSSLCDGVGLGLVMQCTRQEQMADLLGILLVIFRGGMLRKQLRRN